MNVTGDHMLLYGFHRWRGETRRKYWFNILLTDRNIPDDGGVYIFVRRRYIFWLEPIYVGKAASLKSRLRKHERWGEAFWTRGATEKHVRIIKHEEARRRTEEDLVRKLRPPLNRQLTPSNPNDAPRNLSLAARWARRAYWRKAR
tara:strand:- start:1517 stop:1951 length:435 start_codon:yes stop_codon:yes gene_type:complete